MKKIIFCLIFCFSTAVLSAQIGISEIDADQTSTDDAEFIELQSDAPNASLDGYVLVLFNGNDDLSYDSYDLDGFTTDSNGFLILANEGFPTMDLSLSSLQNGPDAVAIYQDDASSFPNDTPLSTTNLVNALVYGTGDDVDSGLLAGLGESVQYNEDANELKDVESIQNAGDGTFCVGAPTPDEANINCSGTPSSVANIAALKSSAAGGTYLVTGEVLITFQLSSDNQMYIEDGSAAILVDDSSGNITTNYEIGDGISGISGQLVEAEGVLKFIPDSDFGAPTSTGNTIAPQTVTLSELNTDLSDYDAELVKVMESTVTTADNEVTTWIANMLYPMATDDGAFIFRTSFPNADYIGDPLPGVLVDITGIITRYDSDDDGIAEFFLTARNSSDIVESLSIRDYEKNVFDMFPNPANGVVHIKSYSEGDISLEIYNILGEQVMSKEVSDATFDVSNLPSGIYLVKIAQNEEILTKKLIVN